MSFVPRGMFLTKGVGRHREELHSFELALRDAGIEKCNLVQVSSILPPGCRLIAKARGIKEIRPGAITLSSIVKNSGYTTVMAAVVFAFDGSEGRSSPLEPPVRFSSFISHKVQVQPAAIWRLTAGRLAKSVLQIWRLKS